MKTIKNLCKRATVLILAVMIFTASAIPAGADIAAAFQGYYYCTTDASYHIFIPTNTTSNFRGEYYSAYIDYGIYAATSPNVDEMYVSQIGKADNLTIEYNSYAKLFGDSFIHQTGKLILKGTIYSDGIRIYCRNHVFAYYDKES